MVKRQKGIEKKRPRDTPEKQKRGEGLEKKNGLKPPAGFGWGGGKEKNTNGWGTRRDKVHDKQWPTRNKNAGRDSAENPGKGGQTKTVSIQKVFPFGGGPLSQNTKGWKLERKKKKKGA